ncbi:MAG: hypothetical protein ACOCWQ_00010 [Nanoarchaeota archaeon]
MVAHKHVKTLLSADGRLRRIIVSKMRQKSRAKAATSYTGRKAKNTTRLADDLLLSLNHPQILHYDGTLMGCYSPYRHNKEIDNRGEESAEQLLNDTNYHADDLLVDNGKCTVHGSYFCDPDGFWSDDATIERPDRIYTDRAGNKRIQHGQGDHLVAANRSKLSQHYSDQNDFSCCPEFYSGTEVSLIALDVLDYLAESSNFDSLYLAKNGAQKVLGIKDAKWSLQEGRMIEYLGVSYEGFTNTPYICDYVESFDRQTYYWDEFSCEAETGSFRVFSRTAMDLWPDLSAVLRLRR